MRADDAARIQDLGETIATHSDDATVREAALTVLRLLDPPDSTEGVKLAVRFAPSVARADTLELPDGRVVGGVRKITVTDGFEHPTRIAVVELMNVTVLGQPEVSG